jgi:transposase
MVERGSDHGGRRRRYSAEEKRRLIAATTAPGASVAAVARAYGLNANMLFNWRRQARRADAATPTTHNATAFVPVGVIGPAVTPPATGGAADRPVGQIEIELPNGVRPRVDASVELPALRRVLAALKEEGTI